MSTTIPEPGDVVVVPVAVKAEHLASFQALLPAWMSELEDPAIALYSPSGSSSGDPEDAWQLPQWTEDDKPACRWVLTDLWPSHQRIVASLVGAPPAVGVTTGEALAHGDYADGTRASGVFRAIGSRFRRVEKRPVWTGGPQTASGQRLSVPDGPARQLFRAVLTEDWPELASEFGIT